MKQLIPFVFRIKSIFLFPILVSKSLFLYGQVSSNPKIEKLQLIADRLQKEIKLKTDSLYLVNETIHQLKFNNYNTLSNTNENMSSLATLKIDGKLRKSNNPLSEIIILLSKGDTINLTDYQSGYWIINKGQFFGYISEIYLNQNEEIDKFKKNLIKRNEEFKILYEREKQIKSQLENNKKLYAKFGQLIGDRLINGEYWIGMTTEMAEISLGSPRNKNKSVGKWGVNEQWVYYKDYLYFENGILESYQKFE